MKKVFILSLILSSIIVGKIYADISLADEVNQKFESIFNSLNIPQNCIVTDENLQSCLANNLSAIDEELKSKAPQAENN